MSYFYEFYVNFKLEWNNRINVLNFCFFILYYIFIFLLNLNFIILSLEILFILSLEKYFFF